MPSQSNTSARLETVAESNLRETVGLCRDSIDAGRALGKHDLARRLRKARRGELERDRDTCSLSQASGVLTIFPATTVELIRSGELLARTIQPKHPRFPWWSIDVKSLLALADRLERRREADDAVWREKYFAELAVHVRERYGDKSADELLDRLRAERRDAEKSEGWR